MDKPVGLIGVGAMGQALLTRLHKAGKTVKTFDVSEECQQFARNEGAEPAASAAGATEGTDMVHVFVRTDEEVLEANLGPGGVLEGAAPGTILFQHSTVLPETTHRIAEAAAKQDVRVLDAPVTAIPRRVHAGEALFLVGGPDDLVTEVHDYLSALGKGMVHFGPLGTGNVAKIAKNFANAGERVLISEILAMVEAGGVDPVQFLDMAASEDSGTLIANWDRAFTIEDGHAVPKRATNLLNKDVRLAAELAESYNLDTPLTQGSARTAAVWVKSWEK
jgi:3-hydroxyisobutyrate dehydrogenase-like beta-hydroxyacid dehydrogenase